MNMRPLLPFSWGQPDNGEDHVQSLHKEIDRVFDEFHRGFGMPALKPGGPGLQTRLSPRLDMAESERMLEVSVELPGVAEQDIDVTIVDDVLTIKGEKKAEREDKGKDYHVIERSYGTFQRSVRLPFDADPQKVRAEFKDGILKIAVDKPSDVETKTQRIPIKSAKS